MAPATPERRSEGSGGLDGEAYDLDLRTLVLPPGGECVARDFDEPPAPAPLVPTVAERAHGGARLRRGRADQRPFGGRVVAEPAIGLEHADDPRGREDRDGEDDARPHSSGRVPDLRRGSRVVELAVGSPACREPRAVELRGQRTRRGGDSAGAQPTVLVGDADDHERGADRLRDRVRELREHRREAVAVGDRGSDARERLERRRRGRVTLHGLHAGSIVPMLRPMAQPARTRAERGAASGRSNRRSARLQAGTGEAPGARGAGARAQARRVPLRLGHAPPRRRGGAPRAHDLEPDRAALRPLKTWGTHGSPTCPLLRRSWGQTRFWPLGRMNRPSACVAPVWLPTPWAPARGLRARPAGGRSGQRTRLRGSGAS